MAEQSFFDICLVIKCMCFRHFHFYLSILVGKLSVKVFGRSITYAVLYKNNRSSQRNH